MSETDRAEQFLQRAHVAEGGIDAALVTLGYAEDFLRRNKDLSATTKMVSLWDYIKKAKGQLERRKAKLSPNPSHLDRGTADT